MSENHRGPEVPKEEVPVVDCLDGFARITSEELATTHFVKNGTLQNLVLQDQEWLSVLGKCSYAHRQVDEQLIERSQKNDDKSPPGRLENLQNAHEFIANNRKTIFVLCNTLSFSLICFHFFFVTTLRP